MGDKMIWKNNDWSIIEVRDDSFSLKYLKGDTFDPRYVDHLSPEQLAIEERLFEEKVEEEGVWGYCLQRWNPEVDRGWETVDSCFGFVGGYSWGKNDHYIVKEMIETANKQGCGECEECWGKGYLPVTTEDNRQQIQECENCTIISRDSSLVFRQASLDGYSFDSEGYLT